MAVCIVIGFLWLSCLVWFGNCTSCYHSWLQLYSKQRIFCFWAVQGTRVFVALNLIMQMKRATIEQLSVGVSRTSRLLYVSTNTWNTSSLNCSCSREKSSDWICFLWLGFTFLSFLLDNSNLNAYLREEYARNFFRVGGFLFLVKGKSVVHKF